MGVASTGPVEIGAASEATHMAEPPVSRVIAATLDRVGSRHATRTGGHDHRRRNVATRRAAEARRGQSHERGGRGGVCSAGGLRRGRPDRCGPVRAQRSARHPAQRSSPPRLRRAPGDARSEHAEAARGLAPPWLPGAATDDRAGPGGGNPGGLDPGPVDPRSGRSRAGHPARTERRVAAPTPPRHARDHGQPHDERSATSAHVAARHPSGGRAEHPTILHHLDGRDPARLPAAPVRRLRAPAVARDTRLAPERPCGPGRWGRPAPSAFPRRRAPTSGGWPADPTLRGGRPASCRGRRGSASSTRTCARPQGL